MPLATYSLRIRPLAGVALTLTLMSVGAHAQDGRLARKEPFGQNEQNARSWQEARSRQNAHGARNAQGGQSANREAGSWRLQLVSEGGLTGKGQGSVAARSDGAIELLERTNRQAPASGHAEYRAICSQPMTADQRARLAAAVAAAEPSTWQPRYANNRNPYAGADEILTTLTFERTSSRGAERREVQWISEREGTLPADLAAIREALLAAMPKGGCTM